jgi:hypothetical protein
MSGMLSSASRLPFQVMPVKQISIAVAICALSYGSILAAETQPKAAAQPACESQTNGGDMIDFQCPLSTATPTRRFHFKANFSGGHDDTSASMTATLNGTSLACDEGSKTKLFAEEGNISLHCSFSIAKSAGTEQLLRVNLLWSHAQYTNIELRAD